MLSTTKIETSILTDKRSRITLQEVLTGPQVLIVSRDVSGVAFDILVQRGRVLDLGIIQLEAAPMPGG